VSCLLVLGVTVADAQVGQGDCVVVADFGESREVSQRMTRGVGRPMLIAPEVLQKGVLKARYTVQADIFSLAYVLWEVVTRESLAAHMNREFARHGSIPTTFRPPMRSSVPPPLAELIERMWSHDPSHRPTAQECVDTIAEMLSDLQQQQQQHPHPHPHP
jgi:serine/threonine protein kinase